MIILIFYSNNCTSSVLRFWNQGVLPYENFVLVSVETSNLSMQQLGDIDYIWNLMPWGNYVFLLAKSGSEFHEKSRQLPTHYAGDEFGWNKHNDGTANVEQVLHFIRVVRS